MGARVNVKRDVAVIRLRHGSANAIDDAFLDALNRALDAIPKGAGVVITGTGKYFSVGLNLKAVYPLDRPSMGEFMARFIATLRRVLTWPGPTVAALNGHALGGGFLLALACDRRMAVPGTRARIGFPDVEEQVPLSHSLRLMALHALPEEVAYLVNGKGENFSPEEAAQRGIVDIITAEDMVASYRLQVPGEDALLGNMPIIEKASVDIRPLILHAVAWVAAQPKDYPQRKAERLAPLLNRLEALGGEDVEYFLDQWFAPETRRAFGRVWERLTGGSNRGERHAYEVA